jgi:glycerol-3-phosphate acyltransferase PlsY
MREEMVISLLALGAYLLGAVPFGFIIGRARGVDIRRVGSGNIGATNVFRTVGKSWGALSLLCDALKGLVPTLLFPTVAAALCDVEAGRGLALLYGCLAVVGHNWPVYLKFKGGKGIATTAGALIGIAPAALGLGFAAWVLVFAVSRYVSLASIVAAIVIPIAAWWLYAEDGALVPAVLTVLGCVAVIRHRSNIARLVKGTESRIRLGKKR